jgi:putative acetyltransferase
MTGHSQVVVAAVDPESEEATALRNAMRAEVRNRYLDLITPTSPEPPSEPFGAGCTLLLAWFGGEAVACAGLRPMADGAVEVRRMYVVPGWRRRGIGRLLLAALEKLALEGGHHALRLETGTRQPEALALYESYGFHRIPAYDRHVGDPMSVCFEKRVKRKPRRTKRHHRRMHTHLEKPKGTRDSRQRR